jgi:predicted aconitase with swiveling domain
VNAAVRGTVLHAGTASGPALVLREPLSLWGGLDPESGALIDAHHPQRGAQLSGRVVLMPGGRGSSSSASVLAEALRAGTAPAALLLGEPDLILAIGAEVADALYGTRLPVVVVDAEWTATVRDGQPISVDEDGTVVATP